MAHRKVLCLHGWGTSSEIFEFQLGPIVDKLQREQSFSFTFADGTIPCDPARRARDVTPAGPFLSWCTINREPTDEDFQTCRDVLDQLDEILEEQGPFDGILGFSQGASIACAYLMLRAFEKGHCAPFRFAIFFSSIGVPTPYIDMLGGDAAEKLPVPSLHIYGTEDYEVPLAISMLPLCEDPLVCVHRNEHVIPRDQPTVQSIVAAIDRLMQRVVA